MTLDDFFTSTEMNNGLTDSFRVRELMAVMQNGNDCHVKNVGDSTRQWSAVASAIAATDNKDSLDLFIQLDGLKFIGMWLKDAQKFSSNTSDSSVGESITHFLRALEKLHVDYEKLVASGIWTTIKVLLVHNNSNVQDKARELYQSWKSKTDGETSLSNVEKNGPSSNHEVGRIEDAERGSEHSEGSASVQVKGQESKSDGPVLAVNSDAEAVQSMAESLEPPSGDERPLDHVDSHSSAMPAIKTPLFNSTVGTTVDSFSPAFSGLDAPCAVSPSDMHTAKVGNSVEKVSLEESNESQEKTVTSCSDAARAINSESESSSQIFTSNMDKSSCEEGPLNDNSRLTGSEGKSTMDDNCYVNQPRSSNVFSAKAACDFKHHMMHRSSSSEKSLRNPMDVERFLSGTDNVGTINKNLQMGDSDLSNNYNFSNKEMDRGSHQGGKNSDVELDYGILDPLELARKVAIEVEREVVDYKEQSGSSSDKLPRGKTRQPDGQDTVNPKQSSASEGSVKDMENDPDSSGEEDSPMREDSTTSIKTLDANQKNVTPDVESPQVTEAVRAEAEKEVGNFDLNLEICSEDNDNHTNQFVAPVSIVAASKAKAAPGQPAGPLKFEGNLGWKGSAATSAFRPASARRILESEMDLSAGGSSSSSKPQQLCLEFDLNVAESVDGESSVATNSRKYEHLELDLNHASEDAGSSERWIGQQFFPQQNGHQSHSHSSSSSSKHPSLRNIDLNGQPSFLNDSSDRSYLTKLSQNHNVSGGVKSDDSVISIMGTRVQVNCKDFVSQTMPVLNGQTPELAFDLNLGRSGDFLGVGSVVPYTHFPLNGYNHIAPGPTMPSTPNLYGSGGPIPYMVDSRGAPVIPQLVGSVSALPTSFAQPPFVINRSGSSPSNWAGPSRSIFDLNSGMMLESGSGEPVGFRQFLSTGHVRPMDEQHLRSNAQPHVSLVGGKRKEPEDGWEQYPFINYAPPWK